MILGSQPAYPLPYFPQETRKKLEYLKSSKIFDQYLDIIHQYKVGDKIQEDV